MSKAVKHCSSCPAAAAAAAAAAEKAATPKGNKIRFVLEDTLPVSSDSTIKVKTFKKFLDYDLKTLNITGELQTTTHKNDFTHTKMIVTYQDKTTNKVNYLELDFLDNTNKEENKNTVGVDGSNRGCGTNCVSLETGGCLCVIYGVVSTTTEPVGPSSLKSSSVFAAGADTRLSLGTDGAGAVSLVPAH